MTQVTQILSQIDQGDRTTAGRLLPLVYDELRKLAAARLANEKRGHRLLATALVHDAYLRLLGDEVESHWNSRGHFLAGAAAAMRRILIDSGGRKKSLKAGGELDRVTLQERQFARANRMTRCPKIMLCRNWKNTVRGKPRALNSAILPG